MGAREKERKGKKVEGEDDEEEGEEKEEGGEEGDDNVEAKCPGGGKRK